MTKRVASFWFSICFVVTLIFLIKSSTAWGIGVAFDIIFLPCVAYGLASIPGWIVSIILWLIVPPWNSDVRNHINVMLGPALGSVGIGLGNPASHITNTFVVLGAATFVLVPGAVLYFVGGLIWLGTWFDTRM